MIAATVGNDCRNYRKFVRTEIYIALSKNMTVTRFVAKATNLTMLVTTETNVPRLVAKATNIVRLVALATNLCNGWSL